MKCLGNTISTVVFSILLVVSAVIIFRQYAQIRALRVQSFLINKEANHNLFKTSYFSQIPNHVFIQLSHIPLMPCKSANTYTITSDRKLFLEEDDQEGDKTTTSFFLSQSELKLILNAVEQNKFFSLDPVYRQEADDGRETSLYVELGDKKKMVTLTNDSNQAIDNIQEIIQFIALENLSCKK